MALMSWDEEFSVGVESIDEQHKRLIEFINSLHEAMLAGRSNEILDSTLSSLLDYTRTHFAYEEALFDKHSYPGAATHKTLHSNLTTKVLRYKSKRESGQTATGMDLMPFLRVWLSSHILGSDKEYGPFLISKGVN